LRGELLALGAEKIRLGNIRRAVWSAATKNGRQPRLFFRSRHQAPETPEQGPPTKTFSSLRDDRFIAP